VLVFGCFGFVAILTTADSEFLSAIAIMWFSLFFINSVNVSSETFSPAADAAHCNKTADFSTV
jgi:hypothetical protein